MRGIERAREFTHKKLEKTRLRLTEILSPESDRLQEHCAVFGVFTREQQAAPLVYIGLSALQHRGQDSAGMTISNDKSLQSRKGLGLVSQVYTEENLSKLSGNIGVGHTRYATFGSKTKHMQPVETKESIVALAHNGNLPKTKKLKEFLKEKHIKTNKLNDSEMMQRAIEYYVTQGMPIEEAVEKSYPLFTGAFSLVLMTKDKLIGIRDSFGIRPLSIGELSDGHILSSETCAIDDVGGKTIGDVKPGEMVVIDREGLHRHQIAKGKKKRDAFEWIYFASPTSRFDVEGSDKGILVGDARRRMGEKLAKERKIDADIVLGVPNSAIPAAAGYAAASGIPYEAGALMKNSYIHRTFILPTLKDRLQAIRRKFKAIPSVLEGKRVILVDDSIVRGPTAKALVELLRKNGAKEVHFLSASPPIRYSDHYGIDTPNRKDLIAANMTEEEIRQYIGADSLQFLSLDGLVEAIGVPKHELNLSCFTNEYPIDIGKKNRRRNSLT